MVILNEVQNLKQHEIRNVRNEILRLTAQSDNRTGEHSSPLLVGNNLSVVPQIHKKSKYIILNEVKNLKQHKIRKVRNEILRLTTQNDNKCRKRAS